MNIVDKLRILDNRYPDESIFNDVIMEIEKLQEKNYNLFAEKLKLYAAICNYLDSVVDSPQTEWDRYLYLLDDAITPIYHKILVKKS